MATILPQEFCPKSYSGGYNLLLRGELLMQSGVFHSLGLTRHTITKWLLFLIPLLFLGASNQQSFPEVDWKEGPETVDLGKNIAQIRLPQGFIFADGRDTKKLMEFMGNSSNGGEVGLIAPQSQSENWFLVFEYDPIGYISDEEKETIDSQAILESLKSGTEDANKMRVEKGFSPLHVTGWHTAPHYDVNSHNLVWALLAEDDDAGPVVNYNTRLLGRHGYMSAVLVTDPASLDSTLPEVENIISGFSYKDGKRYTEFVSGDKLATIGLTALVAGGAGAVAAKTGLLAKIWKFLAIGAIAVFGAIAKFFKSIFRRGDKATDPS